MILRGMAILAGAVLFSANALADIVTYTPASSKEDICQQIEGLWAGTGTMIVEKGRFWSEMTCVYNGSGDIKKTGGGADIALHMTLVKQSGSSSCPAQKAVILNGYCDKQKLIFKTPDADLNGNIHAGGKEADINGHVYFTVHVPIVGDQRVTAEVKDLRLKKQ